MTGPNRLGEVSVFGAAERDITAIRLPRWGRAVLGKGAVHQRRQRPRSLRHPALAVGVTNRRGCVAVIGEAQPAAGRA